MKSCANELLNWKYTNITHLKEKDVYSMEICIQDKFKMEISQPED